MRLGAPNEGRLRRWMEAFASADAGGTPGGGVSRPAASDADRVARDRFRSIAEELGLEVRVDDVGNMFARRSGRDPEALPLVIGSHLDTVVPGGRFDGILGVVVALETVALMNDADMETLHPIDVANWTGEEGARFPPSMLGSAVSAGLLTGEEARDCVDADGTRLGDELSRIGYLGEPRNRLTEFFAALEVHIEQGVILDEAELDVAVVETIRAVQWYRVRVTGTGGHAGGPGPEGRKEALVAAARMIAAGRDRAVETGRVRTTVGTIQVAPGSNNVVPHEATFNIDLRDETGEAVEAYFAGLAEVFRGIADEEGVQVDIEHVWGIPGLPFDASLKELFRTTAEARGIETISIDGNIGHDSANLTLIGPTAMLFTRTTKGLSHREDEHAPWESVVATADLFAQAAAVVANAETLESIAVGR